MSTIVTLCWNNLRTKNSWVSLLNLNNIKLDRFEKVVSVKAWDSCRYYTICNQGEERDISNLWIEIELKPSKHKCYPKHYLIVSIIEDNDFEARW